MRKIVVAAVFFIAFGVNAVWASELVYEPVNPSFGGNAINGGWLINSATSQNLYKDESAAAAKSQKSTTVDSFEQRLLNQILNRLSTNIVSATFGDETIKPGQYDVGGFIINVTDQGTNVRVEIRDPSTGDTTIVDVPFQQPPVKK